MSTRRQSDSKRRGFPFVISVDLRSASCCIGAGLEGQVSGAYVNVALAIGVLIDAEYSSAEHADDIIENVRQLFPEAEVKVHEVRTCQSNKPELDVRYRQA